MLSLASQDTPPHVRACVHTHTHIYKDTPTCSHTHNTASTHTYKHTDTANAYTCMHAHTHPSWIGEKVIRCVCCNSSLSPSTPVCPNDRYNTNRTRLVQVDSIIYLHFQDSRFHVFLRHLIIVVYYVSLYYILCTVLIARFAKNVFIRYCYK